MERFEGFLLAFVMSMMLVYLVLMFVYLPVELQTTAECLRKGYPKAEVSIKLERYCIGYDGAIRPVVVQAN